jgi:hypothetical protein
LLGQIERGVTFMDALDAVALALEKLLEERAEFHIVVDDQ